MTSCVKPCYDRADNKRERKNKHYADNQCLISQSAGRVVIWQQWKSPVHNQVQKVGYLVNVASITNAINRPLDPSRYLDRTRGFLTVLPR